ncbi:Lon protease family protein [Candidatus Thorarchaeota archaeon]|nr:MAG: Lon protease family protein [Candidatus Thorarchaeota archaeon]
MRPDTVSHLLTSIEDTSEVPVPSDPFDRIIGQDSAVRLVKSAVAQRRHVLLCGVPGIGKSMLARAASILLPPPKESIWTIANPVQPERPRVEARRTCPSSDISSPPIHDIRYTRPDALPFEVAVKMGYRCPRCGEFAAPSHEFCMDCGAPKRSSGMTEESYHGLFRMLDMAQDPAMDIVTVVEDQGAGAEEVIYRREAHESILVSRRSVVANSSDSDGVEGATESVLVPLNSNRFVQVSGSSVVEILGDVRHDPYGGADALGTPPHRRVISGAIHEAHEGILYIDELTSLGRYQKHLLTALQDKKYPISGHNPQSSGAAVRVDDVPCDFILFASCNPEDLPSILPPLRSRIRGYGYEILLDSWTEKSPETLDDLVRFIAQSVVEDQRIPHFSRDAVRRVLRIAEEMAWQLDRRRNALTLRLRELGGIIRVSGDLAVQSEHEMVQEYHVTEAEQISQGIGADANPISARVARSSSEDYGSYFF